MQRSLRRGKRCSFKKRCESPESQNELESSMWNGCFESLPCEVPRKGSESVHERSDSTLPCNSCGSEVVSCNAKLRTRTPLGFEYAESLHRNIHLEKQTTTPPLVTSPSNYYSGGSLSSENPSRLRISAISWKLIAPLLEWSRRGPLTPIELR